MVIKPIWNALGSKFKNIKVNDITKKEIPNNNRFFKLMHELTPYWYLNFWGPPNQ
jgi:hypothetical protein